MRRLFAVAFVMLVVVASPAFSQGQPVEPVDKALAEKITKAINAASIPQQFKDGFLARVADALNPKWTNNSRYSMLSRLETDVPNVTQEYNRAQDLIRYFDTAPDATARLRSYSIAMVVDDVGKLLPNNPARVASAVTNRRSEFDDSRRCIVLVRAWQTKFQSDNAPAAMMASYVGYSNSIIDRLGDPATGSALGCFAQLQDRQTGWTNQMSVVSAYDALSARVEREATHPLMVKFRNNRLKGIAGLRVDIGNPKGSVGRDILDGERRDYEQRLKLMQQVIATVEKIKLMPALSQPGYFKRLEVLTVPIEAWHGGEGPDESRLDALTREVTKK